MEAVISGGADAVELDRSRAALVDKLVSDGYIRSELVEAAFRAIPRHLFVPHVPVARAYDNEAIKISDTSSSSQPSIMAAMLEQLALEPGMRVLEIGAGSGYNAALMAHIVGPVGHVVTVDISAELVQAAREHLRAADAAEVEIIYGDGALGYDPGAPYDRVILTVGARDITPAWRNQLKPGGLLVLPLALRGDVQKAVALMKHPDRFESTSVIDCGFMMLQGPHAESDSVMQLGSVPGLSLSVDDSTSVDPDAVYALLRGPHIDVSSGVTVSTSEVWRCLSPWLALRQLAFCSLSAWGDAVDEQIVPPLLTQSGEWKAAHTAGLVGRDELCALALPVTERGDSSSLCGNEKFDLIVRRYGHRSALADRMIVDIRAWDELGRPGMERLEITVHPSMTNPAVTGTQMVLHKRWSTLIFGLRDLEQGNGT